MPRLRRHSLPSESNQWRHHHPAGRRDPRRSCKTKAKAPPPRSTSGGALTPWARINIQQRGQSWTKEAEWWPSRDGLPGGPGLLPVQEPKARPWDRAAETAAVAEPAAHQCSPQPASGDGDAAAWPGPSGPEGTRRPPQASHGHASARQHTASREGPASPRPLSPRLPGTTGAKLAQVVARYRPGPDGPGRGREPRRQPPPLWEVLSRGSGGQEAAGGPGDWLPDPQLPRAVPALGGSPAGLRCPCPRPASPALLRPSSPGLLSPTCGEESELSQWAAHAPDVPGQGWVSPCTGPHTFSDEIKKRKESFVW